MPKQQQEVVVQIPAQVESRHVGQLASTMHRQSLERFRALVGRTICLGALDLVLLAAAERPVAVVEEVEWDASVLAAAVAAAAVEAVVAGVEAAVAAWKIQIQTALHSTIHQPDSTFGSAWPVLQTAPSFARTFALASGASPAHSPTALAELPFPAGSSTH